MAEFSPERARRLTGVVAVAGALVVLVTRGASEAGGYLAGAAISFLSLHSWVRITETVGASGKKPALASGVFLALRFVLIGGAVYGIITVLGVTPVALIVGLLASFAAVILELLYGVFKN